ncbi:acyltransferase family protein [uncultured Kocuria sp.]|uniref:acyltransferase family protein n=1 Tax=uncultured Kocuria sp. TaxID=259305 RepID=UPI00263329D6|nr:acyltransferase family protein [uncultured Kocuria sp.]
MTLLTTERTPTSRAERAAGPVHRPEVQGLRGVAVLLVVAFHVWTDRVSGGVDVFFVLSAFLLTGSFVRRVESGRPLALRAYWLRTFSRLLGPLAVMLLAVLAVVLLLFPPSRWETLVGHAWGSLLYVQNWVLAAEAVDYYAGGGAASTPLQHTWSLSVQGQVFLLWPLLLAGTAWAAHRTGARFRVLAGILFTVVLAASLARSVLATAASPDAAYFDTSARLWEFALGSLAALAVAALSRPGASASTARRGLAAGLGWAGLATVVATPFVVDAQTRFPGSVALAPTLGAAAVLLAGALATGTRGGVDRILTVRPLVRLGDHAYGVYLWHWPLLIAYALVTVREDVPVAHGVGILLGSLLLTWATAPLTRLPVLLVHAWRTLARRPLPGAGDLTRLVATLLLVAVPVGAAQGGTLLRTAQQQGLERSEENYPGAAVLRGEATAPTGVPPVPTDAERETEWGETGLECAPGDGLEAIGELGDCWAVGPTDGTAPSRTIVVIGDSHAMQLLTPVTRAAERRGWAVISYLRMGCRYAAGSPGRSDACNDFNAAARDAALEQRPDAVLTIGTRSLAQAPHEELEDGYEEGIAPLLEAGLPVVAFRDNPRFPYDMFECVETYGADHPRCNEPRSEALLDVNPLLEVAARHEGLHVVDLTDRLCTADVCPAVVGNVVVYRDLDHVTSSYGATLTPDVEERLTSTLGW